MNKNYGYNFNLRRSSISESGEEYEEGEPDINPETDPEKEFQEREFNPDEDYEWEDEYNPDEDYDWEDEYNPDEDYDWGDEYNPDEDYDWGDEFNPDKEYDWGDDNFEPVNDPPDNENDYESNLSREGTETILSPSEHPEEQLERVIDSESQNISEQNIERKPEEIDEFELVTPEGKAEKPAEPPEIIELMEGGSYNSDYTSEQEPELSSEIEPKTELEDHPEQEFLNESEDKPKEELEKELELINPETGEPVPRQPEWEYIPLQDYLEQLLEQQENRDEVQEIEPKEELEKIPDQESELISEHNLENISDKKSEKSFDQKSELIQEPESEKILKHNQGEAYKTDHLKEKDSITDPKELKKSKHHEYQHLIKTKYEPIFSQIELRKSQKKSKRSDKITEISQKTKKKSRAEESKEINLKNDSTLAEKKEKRHKVEVDYSSEQIQHISKNRAEKYEELETSEILELPKQEKLKEKQKREFSSSELLELQERYRQETGKRPIYNKEQTKGFKEWLESQKEYTLIKTDSNRKSENREEWELFLKQWINEANETEVSKEKKEELLNIIRKYHQNREIYRRLLQLSEKKELTRKKIEEIKILIKKLEETTSIQKKIFKNLRAFRAFYNENIRWYKHKIIAEKHKFLKHLSQKLNYLKEAKNPRKDIKQNWKELLNENLYKNITLNFHDKSLIDKILQKEEFTEDDKKELISILSKLPTEELITLLGNEFKKHTQHYVKWGWDYDPGVKRVMLNKYLASKLFCIDKSRRKNQICKSDEYVIDKNMTEIRILPEIVSIQQAKESIVASIRYTRQDKKDIRDVDINENIKYNPNFVLVGLPHFNPEQEIDVVFNQPIKDFVNNLKRQYYTISYDIKLAFYKSGNLIEIDQNSEEDITHWLIRNGYSKDEVIYIRPVDKDYHGPIYEKSCWIEGSPSPYTTHFDNLRIKLKDLAYRLVLINEYTFAATSRFLFPKEKSGTYIYLVNTYAQMSRGEQFNIQETSLLKMHARFLNNLENLSKTKQITDKEYTKYNNEINDLFNEQYSLYGYNNPNPFYTLGRINAHRIGDLLMEYGFIEENSITGINGIYEFINAFGGSRSSLTMDNYKKKKIWYPRRKDIFIPSAKS